MYALEKEGDTFNIIVERVVYRTLQQCGEWACAAQHMHSKAIVSQQLAKDIKVNTYMRMPYIHISRECFMAMLNVVPML